VYHVASIAVLAATGTRVIRAVCCSGMNLQFNSESRWCLTHFCVDVAHALRPSARTVYLAATWTQWVKPYQNCKSSPVNDHGRELRQVWNSVLLDYGAATSAYYIRCHDCIADYSETPDAQHWTEWLNDLSLAEKKLEQLHAVTAQ